MEKENKMSVMPVPRLVITMALPLMLSLLVQSLYNIVDGIFVGMISEDAFTATSLAYPVQLLMVAISVGTGVGVNAVCSHMIGAKKYDAAGHTATTGLILSFASSLIFVIFGLFFLPIYLRGCSGSAASVEMCGRYLYICTVFCLGIFVETLGQRLLQATGRTTLSMISLVCGAVTNIILDPVLIFVCNMGIEGAAVATVIGQWVGAVIAFILHLKVDQEIRFSFKQFHIDLQTVWSIYKVGLPTILTQAMGSIMMLSFNSLLGELLPAGAAEGAVTATSAIAFFGAYYKLQNFLYMPIMGLGQAAIPIVGFNYGAKKLDRVRAVVRTAIPAAVGYALLGTFVFELIPGQLLSIFSASDGSLAVGIPGLRIIAVTFTFGAATTVLGYACSGLGSGVVNMIGTCLRQIFPLIPLAGLLGRLGGISAIWYSVCISEIIAAGFTVSATYCKFRKKLRWQLL